MRDRGAFVAAFAVLASVAPVSSSTLAAQGRSAIIGVVVSGEEPIPLPGARVTITRPDGADTTLVTDPRGRFALRKVAGGRY